MWTIWSYLDLATTLRLPLACLQSIAKQFEHQWIILIVTKQVHKRHNFAQFVWNCCKVLVSLIQTWSANPFDSSLTTNFQRNCRFSKSGPYAIVCFTMFGVSLQRGLTQWLCCPEWAPVRRANKIFVCWILSATTARLYNESMRVHKYVTTR